MLYSGCKTSIECSRQTAMTAIELLIAVVAVGLLLLITVPGSSMLIERHRLNAASNDLARSLSLARSEANLRGSTVRLCPSVDGRVCRSDGDWSHGWLVYSDGNADGVVQDIELIESFDGPAEEVRIIGLGPVQKGAAFTLSGLMGNAGERSAEGGEFLVCYVGSPEAARAVVIDAEGWVNVIPGGNANCGMAPG